MPDRIVAFVFCQLLGAALGGWLAGERGAFGGALAGALAWFVVDLVRGWRVLRWLRGGAEDEPPAAGGPWGETADRIRRALRLRERASEEAGARLQAFLAAIQASPNGVVLLDAQGRIEWCNQTAAAQLGIDPERDLLQHVGNLLRDPAFADYNAAGAYYRDVVITGRDSSPGRPVRLSLQLHPYGEGRKLLLSRDVTAVEQADTMRRDFVANVSHEVRTPLTVLAGFIETLQQLPLDEADRARYLTLMSQQAHRMQSLVNDLLTLSRLEGSPSPGVSEWTAAGALLAQCEQDARSLSAVLGKDSHEFVFESPAGLEVGGASPELLSAMSNLASNAVRYTPVGGRIEARWRLLPDGRAEFSVRDTGPGIPPEHLPRLTERFYRVDRSRSRETGGTGLGLAIVKHVAQRHGAELRIDSQPGAGSTFAIVLPAARARMLTPPPPGGASAPRARATP
ncbi:phosphate regulon sensor histidine kinase PhoR [Ramlibacter tataouinensis]|uniref:phosphate regulon sensor histidine kinase PhoR n=1 Tax=Ramlibacter tataouinensis TaxID=94132 RepID=UPI0022F394B3|nr:phosphate regulon sensor histidine kinase PhoR [Ramlibacter tataouinensis]WBY02228.1 phosphate regulon sensor histidine kinase PhoR [Ramlibacter tataouinensis]